jgi:hypothetical protein
MLHKLELCELNQWAKSGYRDSNSVKYIFANLSDASYKPSMKDKQDVLNKSGLNKEYKIIPEYTNRDITTFWDTDCKKVVMVIRGTDDKDILGMKYRDFYTDAHLALGLLNRTKRYQESEAMLNRIKNKFGAENIILSGHSLGGRIAGGLSQKYHYPAIIYNQGASPLDFAYNRAENKLTTHFTTNSLKNLTIDPLSVSSMLGQAKNITVATDTPKIGLPASIYRNHSLSNFTGI